MKQVHNEAIQAQSKDCGTLRGVQSPLELPLRPQYPAVVISLVRLSYARHMRAYVICGGLICGAYAAYGKVG